METNENIENNELKESFPKLFSANKENPFDVPAGYFENLSSEITEKSFQSYNKKKEAAIHLSYMKILIPAAITTVLIFIILFFLNQNVTKTTPTKQFAFNENNTFDYLENLISNDELDEHLLVSALVKDDTNKTLTEDQQISSSIISVESDTGVAKDTVNNTTISKEAIIQYLLENDESDDAIY